MTKPATERRPKIIVNADDFGMSPEVNRAIVEAFEENLISSATLMANMPGFEEACELAHRHGLAGKIGVHLNLTSGHPLSMPIRHSLRLCDEKGEFRKRETRLRMSGLERIAVEEEMAAQVKLCLDRGILPTHLDSHHHVHTEWAIGAAAIAVARRYGIGAIRLSRNCGVGIGPASSLYKLAYNTRLRLYGLARTRYFGSPADVSELAPSVANDVEVMVHFPCGQRETATGDSTGSSLARWFATHRLVGYSS
jgi:predicted glycoside hydrolase/deacetylase ChbG (UPF0249 family)